MPSLLFVRTTPCTHPSPWSVCHHGSYQYNINRTMRYKIEFFCDKLKPDSGIKWETPIAHLIHRKPFATTIGDSSLEGAGGFSVTLGFWWHICCPDEVVQRTLRFKTSNDDGMLLSINVLEFVMVIINYCTALHVVWTSPITDDPHHVERYCDTFLVFRPALLCPASWHFLSATACLFGNN